MWFIVHITVRRLTISKEYLVISYLSFFTYFRFPKDPFQKEKWIDATGRQNWMPVNSSTICSIHFSENDFLITAKGYRYLAKSAIPIKKIVIFHDHISTGGETSLNLSKKRKADFSNDCDSNSGPCTKKSYEPSEDASFDIPYNMPGPSRKQDIYELSNINVKKETQINEMTHSTTVMTKSTALTKRVAEESLDFTPRKKSRSSSIQVTGIKRGTSVLEEDSPGVIKKTRKDDDVRISFKRGSYVLMESNPVTNKKMRMEEDIRGHAKKRVGNFNPDCQTSPKRSKIDPDQLSEFTYSTPRKIKLCAKLRWAENKVKTQKLKIKRLQTQSRRLKRKINKMEDILKELKEKFAMSNENISTLQNLNVQVC
ncbi:uncharacterized protein LOC125227501 isoform X1 [Leguminivora glycinivorella]|uniref:uncharacterized protein LOC125227501 isoform X1 n=1 Tax=Leguminivora glycinivorella TaxID=1035111 RepID=UPI00200E6E26|nr:uncharacterized protein LOC125227501 isoform X1 [Leguminivora glycinivorella]